MHPTNLEDAEQRVGRAKLDINDKYLFLSATIPVKLPPRERAINLEASLILSQDTIVTVTHEKTDIFRKEEQEQDKVADVILSNTPPLLAYRFLEAAYDTSAKAIKQIENSIARIDRNILNIRSPQIIQEISILQRNIIFFISTLNASIPYYEELEKRDVRFKEPSMKEYWGDLVDKLHQQLDVLQDYDLILAKLAQAHSSVLSYHTNYVVQILTIFSAILLPLNLVAGIYGMNIILPFAGNPYALLGILLTMLAMIGVMVVYFRYRKWF